MVAVAARMASSKRSSKKPGPDRDNAVLFAEGGVQRMPAPADPVQAWIDLMQVVEMLRPQGRPRAPRRTVGRFLL